MPRPTVFADPPVLCGHRGSGRGVVAGNRENSLASFRAAVAAGLGWVEVDARLSVDAVLVARHDPVLDDGRFVADLPADELGLMRVADLLDDLPPAIAVDIDVKSSLEDALRPRQETTAARVAGLAAAEAERRRVLVTSFDPAALLIVRELAPSVPLGLLTWLHFPLRKAIAAAAQLGVEVVGPHVESLAPDPRERPLPESVRVAHEAGLQVVAWCPDAAQAGPLIAAGVDCLVVDEVPAAVAWGLV
jgi:glycerophosphoryl diester phosphodiesterase